MNLVYYRYGLLRVIRKDDRVAYRDPRGRQMMNTIRSFIWTPTHHRWAVLRSRIHYPAIVWNTPRQMWNRCGRPWPVRERPRRIPAWRPYSSHHEGGYDERHAAQFRPYHSETK